jgi:hypothetical protein
MPAIDFTEIPPANSRDGSQDTFELFARDFLAALGFNIEEGPSRGADRGKDLLVCETLSGVVQPKNRRWVVSCKHNAHSGKAVGDGDENDIVGRVRKFKADGFMAFYSTIPSSALTQTLTGHKDEIDADVWDREKIEEHLVSRPELETVFRRYFPKSSREWRKRQLTDELMRQVSKGKGQETIELTLEEGALLLEEIGKWQMTANEWNNIFPAWPNLPPSGKPSVIFNTEYAQVLSIVLLPEHWPGIVAPNNDLLKVTIFRAGRWTVTNDGVLCLGSGYEIGFDRLDEMDWFAHLLDKPWLYDPSDMIDSLEAARAYIMPHESQTQREDFINSQIQEALKQHQIPFYPSRTLGLHIYLASHMSNKERIAFCQFLAEHSYVAEPRSTR